MNILNFFYITATIGLVVTIHEFGHAVSAIICEVPIKTINIGIPIWPKFKFKYKNIDITFTPWIILGFVQLDDEKLNNLHFLKRIVVYTSGPLSNIFAFLATVTILAGPKEALSGFVVFLADFINIIGSLLSGSGASDVEILSPIGIIDVGQQMLSENGVFVGLLVLWLSLNIGVAFLNLLPIPPLDGGKTFLSILSGVFGDTPKSKMASQIVEVIFTLVLIIAFMLLIAKDIIKLFK